MYTERDVLPESLCIEIGVLEVSCTVRGVGVLERMCCFHDWAGPVIVTLRDILWSHSKLLWNQLCILKDALPWLFKGLLFTVIDATVAHFVSELSTRVFHCVFPCKPCYR